MRSSTFSRRVSKIVLTFVMRRDNFTFFPASISQCQKLYFSCPVPRSSSFVLMTLFWWVSTFHRNFRRHGERIAEGPDLISLGLSNLPSGSRALFCSILLKIPFRMRKKFFFHDLPPRLSREKNADLVIRWRVYFNSFVA